MKEENEINFSVDRNNLYREEVYTDLKAASIRRMVPVKPDGSPDPGRTPFFVGSTQLMTPDGMLPLQARLMANTLTEAYEAFPYAMRQALAEVLDEIKKMQAQEESRKREKSRIIVPGRQ